MNPQVNYSTKLKKRERKKDIICAVIVSACLGACVWLHLNTKTVAPVWTESFPMANAGMQWAYTSDPRCQP